MLGRKKKEEIRDKKHHGLRWDQIRFCVSEDLIEV